MTVSKVAFISSMIIIVRSRKWLFIAAVYKKASLLHSSTGCTFPPYSIPWIESHMAAAVGRPGAPLGDKLRIIQNNFCFLTANWKFNFKVIIVKELWKQEAVLVKSEYEYQTKPCCKQTISA